MCSSPETLVRLDNGRLITFPVAGSRPRGKTPEEDKALENELLADEKELSEHNMLVDLGRNDLGRVSKIGTVEVTGNMDTCIAIRMAAKKNGTVTVQAGGGIVADSVPYNEYMESANKAKAVMNAIERASEVDG